MKVYLGSGGTRLSASASERNCGTHLLGSCGALSRREVCAGAVEPTSQNQPLGGIEEYVNHGRVLQVSGYVTDQARDDRSDRRAAMAPAENRSRLDCVSIHLREWSKADGNRPQCATIQVNPDRIRATNRREGQRCRRPSYVTKVTESV
jgi:hypothetical protein